MHQRSSRSFQNPILSTLRGMIGNWFGLDEIRRETLWLLKGDFIFRLFRGSACEVEAFAFVSGVFCGRCKLHSIFGGESIFEMKRLVKYA